MTTRRSGTQGAGKWCKLPCWPEVTCETELRMGEVGVATRDWSVEVKDVTPLVGEGTSRSRCSKSRLLLWLTCLLSLLLLLLSAAYWVYWKDVVGLRVMALNTWGMPHTLGSQVTQSCLQIHPNTFSSSCSIASQGYQLSKINNHPLLLASRDIIKLNGFHRKSFKDPPLSPRMQLF